MAAAREKLRASRKKKLLDPKASTNLLQPMSRLSVEEAAPREKIKVPVKARSALVPGEGRSMGMEVD